MRDVSRKVVTFRTAVARALLRISPSTVERIRKNELPKGDPLPVAKIAAIQAAKNTCQLIPYCHQIALEFVGVEFEISNDSIAIETTVKAANKTGVEMEALTAASVAALTIYDMVKFLDDLCEIERVYLVKKTGGKSDWMPSLDRPVKAAVLVMSDSVSAGAAKDKSGKIIVERLESYGVEIAEYKVVKDEMDEILAAVRENTDDRKVDLLLTTGGTGISPRDTTPEALRQLIERPLPGVDEAMRSYGQPNNPYAMLSRALSGVRGKTIIVSIPGSSGAARDALDALFPYLLHSLNMLEGKGHKNCEPGWDHSRHGHGDHDHSEGNRCDSHSDSHDHGDSHKKSQSVKTK